MVLTTNFYIHDVSLFNSPETNIRNQEIVCVCTYCNNYTQIYVLLVFTCSVIRERYFSLTYVTEWQKAEGCNWEHRKWFLFTKVHIHYKASNNNSDDHTIPNLKLDQRLISVNIWRNLLSRKKNKTFHKATVTYTSFHPASYRDLINFSNDRKCSINNNNQPTPNKTKINK